MLAAQELRISKQLYQALQKVLKRLETGDLVHIGQGMEHDAYFDFLETHECPNGFNMRTLLNTNKKCGTVGCIAGWAAIEMGISPSKIPGWDIPALQDLFYPPIFDPYSSITTAQAAQALRNYLTLGSPDWENI